VEPCIAEEELLLGPGANQNESRTDPTRNDICPSGEVSEQPGLVALEPGASTLDPCMTRFGVKLADPILVQRRCCQRSLLQQEPLIAKRRLKLVT